MLLAFALTTEWGSNLHWQAPLEHVANALTNCATLTQKHYRIVYYGNKEVNKFGNNFAVTEGVCKIKS